MRPINALIIAAIVGTLNGWGIAQLSGHHFITLGMGLAVGGVCTLLSLLVENTNV